MSFRIIRRISNFIKYSLFGIIALNLFSTVSVSATPIYKTGSAFKAVLGKTGGLSVSLKNKFNPVVTLRTEKGLVNVIDPPSNTEKLLVNNNQLGKIKYITGDGKTKEYLYIKSLNPHLVVQKTNLDKNLSKTPAVTDPISGNLYKTVLTVVKKDMAKEVKLGKIQ